MTPFVPFIPAPRVRSSKNKLPHTLARTTLSELCTIAGVPVFVSGGEERSVTCIVGTDHFSVGRDYFVGVGNEWEANQTKALRVLEVLAHGFHDYAARECVCHKKFFSPPKRQGRPPVGARAKTARERMAAMRARRATATPA
jgi:hypothetical protein